MKEKINNHSEKIEAFKVRQEQVKNKIFGSQEEQKLFEKKYEELEEMTKDLDKVDNQAIQEKIGQENERLTKRREEVQISVDKFQKDMEDLDSKKTKLMIEGETLVADQEKIKTS